MAKPQLLYNSTWTTTSVQNDVLYSFQVGTTMESIAYYANKIQGYQLCRGTAVVTVVINANPFQQGKLLLHFLPTEDSSIISLHNTVIASKRMQPCVEIDARDSGCVMKVPYVQPTNWYGIVTDTFDWGSFYLSVLAPMQTGATGETEVAVTLYLHFEDFEFAAPIVPQSAVSNRKYSARTVSKEQRALSSGQITKGLSLAATIADSVSSIPTLSAVAEPAAWVFRGLGALASHFGWSKSNIETIPQLVVRSQNRFGAVCDGVDSAAPLALITTNRITVSSANSLTDEDEMSFEYLKRIPTVISTFAWNASSTNGTVLKTQEIDPFQFKQTSTKVVAGHTMTYGVGPPIYYLSNIFGFYRGSIKLTLKFAKTEFHSGRLQVVYTPLDTAAITTAPTLTNTTLSLREIIDIRNGNEFTLVLPYLRGTNYLSSGTIMGSLQISILNELRCPETCAQTINCLMYVSGGDDFEFQAYSTSGINDNGTTIFQNFVRVFSPQMDVKQVDDGAIGNSKIQNLTLQYPQQSVGESFSSIKQLLLRLSHVYFRSVAASTGATSPAFYPFTTGILNLDGAGLIASPNVGGDLYSFLANMYVFFKGGMSVQILPANTGDVTGMLYQFNTTDTQLGLVPCAFGFRGSIAWNNLTQKTMSSGLFTTDGGYSINVMEVPYYSKYKVSKVTNAPSTSSVVHSINGGLPRFGIQWSSSSTSTLGSYAIERAVRDDFVLSYFIGCPPVALSYV